MTTMQKVCPMCFRMASHWFHMRCVTGTPDAFAVQVHACEVTSASVLTFDVSTWVDDIQVFVCIHNGVYAAAECAGLVDFC
jgi:hypothetical protein